MSGWVTARVQRLLGSCKAPEVRPVSRVLAWVGVLVLYVAGGWAGGVVAAVYYLRHPSIVSVDQRGTWNALLSLFASAHTGGLVLPLVVVALVAVSWREALGLDRPWRERWRVELSAGAWAIVLVTIAFFVAALTTHLSKNVDVAQGGWAQTIADLFAGSEELGVLVAPLLLLRGARYSWPVVVVTLVLLRVSFHIYYGPGAAWLALWAAGMIVVYLRTRAVVGIFVAHALYDLTSAPVGFGHPTTAAVLRNLLILLALIVVVVAAVRGRRRRRAAMAPRPAGAPPAVP